MFEGGIGLPIAAIGWSIVISFAGCWAWLETAHFWAFLQDWMLQGQANLAILSTGYVAFFIAAAFALLAQWTANFVVLRIRRGNSRFLWAAYAICALYAAVSLHHVHEAMQAPAWAIQVTERASQRASDESIIHTNDLFLAQVQSRTLELDTTTVAARTNAVSAPMIEAAERAERSSAQARTRLETVPALPSQRPLDFADFAVGLLAAALALLEFALYWGIGAPVRSAASVTMQASADMNAGLTPALSLVPKPVAPSKPRPVKVGDFVSQNIKGGKRLLVELEEAGLVNEHDIRSRLSTKLAERRWAANKVAA